MSIKDIINLLQRIKSVVERVISLPAALIFMIGGNWPVEVLFTDFIVKCKLYKHNTAEYCVNAEPQALII